MLVVVRTCVACWGQAVHVDSAAIADYILRILCTLVLVAGSIPARSAWTLEYRCLIVRSFLRLLLVLLIWFISCVTLMHVGWYTLGVLYVWSLRVTSCGRRRQ